MTLFSALATLVVSNLLQRKSWGYQKRTELRLAACEQLSRLATNFLIDSKGDHNFRPDDEFFKSLMVTNANIKVLFSARTFNRFKKLEAMIPGFGPEGKVATFEFAEALDEALRALYEETVGA